MPPPELWAVVSVLLAFLFGPGLTASSVRKRCLSLTVLTASALVGVAGPALAQTPTEAARADAKSFGRTLIPNAQRAGRTPPSTTTMPNFEANPAQRAYLTNEAALAPDSAAAAPAHQGYSAVRESMTTRPAIAPVDIETTIARSNTIQEDPSAYVSGMSIDGAPSTCVELPPAVASPGRYEQSCSRGFVRTGGATTRTCPVLLRHTVTVRTEHRYECSEDFWAPINRTDRCSIFPIGGTCEITGTRPGTCLQWSGPPGRRWCSEPGEPITILSCSATVPGGRILSTRTVPTVVRTVDESACATLEATATCSRTSQPCTDSDPRTRMIDGVAVTESCWGWTRNYSCAATLTPRNDCSTLESNGCTFLREECITGEDPCLTFDRVYSCPIPPEPTGGPQHICDGDIYCINGECETIERTPNNEIGQAAVALNAAKEAGKQFDPATLTLFKGTRHTCSKAVFGLSNCCVPRGFPLIGSCNGADRILKQKREKGLCARVGSYCSRKVLGICLTRREAHCCFESKLSRIIHEQGRPQVGFNWIAARDEQCKGFTIAQFARLDLSVMDFSEVLSEFVDAATIPSDIEIANELQAKIDAYYAANGLD